MASPPNGNLSGLRLVTSFVFSLSCQNDNNLDWINGNVIGIYAKSKFRYLKITTQKPLASWNASFGQVLRTPVLYNSQDDSLLVAISDKTIIKWNTTEDIIDKGQKTTVSFLNLFANSVFWL